ncbi:tyrosine-type recombinase/integrase [Sabulicella rubraurantiaca]|uniref:tyrosine-type recombinase/integrase n=1 Tax=Sabulicella rubraurantiaca TaxID=2811429 RepID=UPI001A96812D|nr:tyrosine-type recombinase/integrase [Sabulicella rubraurantiaca]
MAAKRGRIGLREVRALGPGEDMWDAGPGAVTGFGIRRQRSEAVAYVLIFRTAEGRSRRYTIGRHGAPWTPDAARDEARRILAVVTGGGDPATAKKEMREAPTVAELCQDYLAAAEAGRLTTRRSGTKKASTLAADRSRIESHVLPLLGPRKVRSVTTADIEAFMHDVADGKTHRREHLGRARAVRVVRGNMGAASRTVGMLGAIFAFAVKKGMRPDNPARGVLRPADGKRDRRLTAEEYAALARGLEKALRPAAEGEKPRRAMWPHAVAAIRFLALTGWRSGEALTLRWREVDLPRRTARLGDTKTGASMRALPHAACAVLEVQRATTGGDPAGLVFPPARGGEDSTMTGFKRAMAKAVELAELPKDVTAHVLRHSFASVAADLDLSEIAIAALIGHRGRSVTSRYVHSADAVLLAAADKVAGEVARQMGAPGAEVTDLASVRDYRARV